MDGNSEGHETKSTMEFGIHTEAYRLKSMLLLDTEACFFVEQPRRCTFCTSIDMDEWVASSSKSPSVSGVYRSRVPAYESYTKTWYV